MFVLAVHTYWMCKCVHTCVCVLVCMSLCGCVHAHIFCTVCVCALAHVYVHVHAQSVCVNHWMYEWVHVFMCVCTHKVCVCVCECVYKMKVGSERFWSVSGLSVPPTAPPLPNVIYYECHAWICCRTNITLHSEILFNKQYDTMDDSVAELYLGP